MEQLPPTPPRPTPPTLYEIANAWRDLGDELATIFPGIAGRFYSWGDPACFRCGWVAPKRASDYPHKWKAERAIEAAWKRAAGWLERAHLHDHQFGGSSEPLNMAPLCLLCHEMQPLCRSRDEGVAFVNSRARHADIVWMLQMQTDRTGANVSQPGKSVALRHMLRAALLVAISTESAARKTFRELEDE